MVDCVLLFHAVHLVLFFQSWHHDVWVQVPAVDLVRGDIIVLETGDKIPADARIIACSSLSMNFASLTGETEPILGTAAGVTVEYTESANMAWLGTTVLAGSARAVVTCTGDRTRLGKVSFPPPPLQAAAQEREKKGEKKG